MNSNTLSLHIGNGLLVGQLFDFLGGLCLLLLGGAILYTLASWRFHGLQRDGEIIGIRRRGPYFHSVYRYVLAAGEIRQATSIQGSLSPQGLSTGRHVPIQVMPGKLDEARELHAPLQWALTVSLLAGGAWLIYLGERVSKHGPIVYVLMLLAVALLARWIRRRVQELLVKLQPVALTAPWSALPIESADSLGTASTVTTRLSSGRNTAQRSGRIFLILGVGVLALACWQSRSLLQLRNGVRTSGIVMELSEGSAGRSSDTFLFPVVQYAAPDGSLVRFYDRTGARPSPFKVGDTVPVVYLPGRPATATIDRGLSNWEPLAWLSVLGMLMTGLGVAALRSR